jgi:phosphoglycolate phosphatase
MTHIRCVVFDFDGVLVDSNPIKRHAYFEIFRCACVSEQLIATCLNEHPEGDRYDVIACVLERAASAAPAAGSRDVGSYAAEYGRLCEAGVAACAEVPHATEILATLAKLRAVYISSATPEHSLQRLVAARGWTGHVRYAFGRPGSKLEHLARILNLEQIAPREMCFVGDRRSDYRAALEAGCRFIGRISDESDFDAAPALLIQELASLPALLDAQEAC